MREDGLLVIVENLQQVVSSKKDALGRVRDENTRRRAEVDFILATLKKTANDTGIPIIISTQLTRDSATENRRPTIGDLKETGLTAEITQKVLLPFRPEYHAKSSSDSGLEDAQIIIARGGRPTAITMCFDNNTLSWKEPE